MYDHFPDAETATSAAFPDSLDRARPAAPPVRATDGERLMRFRLHRDEAAFREVVEAHAALVWGVCWQVLRRREDVEDAFQATFLILARKCVSIRATDSAAGWLYRVAFRTALAARARRRRLTTEPLTLDPPGSLEEQLTAIERAEQCEALLEELHALGDRYRQPLVLCYLEGRSRQEAADELGVTMASVKGRLARGLRMLRTRLATRGVALSSATALVASELATAKAAAAMAPVTEATAAAATFGWAASTAQALADSSTTTSPGALLLAKKGILAMKYAAIVKPVLGMFAVGVTAGAIALAGGKGDGLGAGNGSAADSAATTAEVSLFASDAETAHDSTKDELAPNTFVAITPDNEERLSVVDAPTSPPHPQLTVTSPGTLTYTEGAAPNGDFDNGAGTLSIANGELAVNGTWTPTANWTNGEEASADEPMSPPVQPPQDVLIARPPQPTIAALPSGGSVIVMELEREHWQLKARGLQYKIDAMKMKAAEMADRGEAFGEAALTELEAEAHLAKAEMKLCEARAQQLKETLEAVGGNASLASPTIGATTFTPASGQFTYSPTASTTAVAASMASGSPLVVQVSPPPSPAQVGAPTLLEFTVVNVFEDEDENVELQIPVPESWTVDQKRIATPPQVKTKVEDGKLIFSPAAMLRKGEVLKYRVPFTPKRAGDSVVKVKATSKQHPRGVESVMGIRVFDKLEPTTGKNTVPARDATKIRLDGLAGINDGATLSIAGMPEESADLRKLIDDLQRRNAELERRLRELEKDREAGD